MITASSEFLPLTIDNNLFIICENSEQRSVYRYAIGGSVVLGIASRKANEDLIFKDDINVAPLYVEAMKRFLAFKVLK